MNLLMVNMTKFVYQLTQDAKKDLIDIRRYTLSQWGEVQSQLYLSALKQALQRLAEFPAIGKHRPEIAQTVYSFVYVSHIIYYTLQDQKLVVFAVIHQSRAPLVHLESRIKS